MFTLQLMKKIEKSAKVLNKLRNESRLSDEEPDLEIISKEERVCLREMGLRISSILVLGKKKIPSYNFSILITPSTS